MRKEYKKHVKAVWQKYRAAVLLWFALGTLIYVAVTVVGNLTAPPSLSLITVNLRLSRAGSEYLRQSFDAHTDTEQLLIAEAELEPFETRKDLGTNYYALQALLSLHAGQELDILLMDQAAMENLLRQDICLDLRKLFSEEELLFLAESSVWGMHRDEPEARPLVLDVTDLTFIRNNTDCGGKVYLAITDNTSQLQACRIFWEVMSAWEASK